MLMQQLSVFIENKPGRLQSITGALAEAGISLRALSIADTADYGILRLIVADPAQAETVLKAAGFMVSITQVLGVAVSDAPGGLHQALAVLGDAGIDVAYMYAFVTPKTEQAMVVLRVEDNAKAISVLSAAGIPLLAKADIAGL